MEPTLQNISDYDTLKGEKKKTVWAVVLSGLVLGGIYMGVNAFYGEPSDAIHTTDKVAKIPLK